MTPPSAPPPTVWLDHFVVAIDDLEAGINAFESMAGVRPAYGGEHPALGTHNALVSLGRDQYLEILAPRPGAKLDPRFRAAGEHTSLTPILWALATDDIETLHSVATSAGFAADEPTSGSRLTENGDTLRWTIFMVRTEGVANAPFFIQWDPDAGHPAASSPAGCRLRSFAIDSPDHESLERLLASVGFAVPVGSSPARTLISLETPRGSMSLGE